MLTGDTDLAQRKVLYFLAPVCIILATCFPGQIKYLCISWRCFPVSFIVHFIPVLKLMFIGKNERLCEIKAGCFTDSCEKLENLKDLCR